MKQYRKHILLPLLMLVLMLSSPLYAATRTASASGNWSSTATWGGEAVPTAGDDVIINSGISVTVDIASAFCASLTLEAATGTTALTFSGSNTLTVTGLVTMDRPGSGNNSSINLNAGTLSCAALQLDATTAGRLNTVTISTGTLTISGSITFAGSDSELIFSGAGTLNLGGTFTGSPTFTTVSGSTVNYTGANSQTIFATSYNGNLGISGEGSKYLDAATTVNDTLFLLEGILENESFLTMADGSAIYRSAGTIVTEPTFSGTVDLVYAGASALTTSYEIPVSSGSLGNLTANSGGLTQGGTPGALSTLLSDAFPNLSNWTGDVGNSNNEFRAVNSANAGGSSREARYTFGASPSVSYTSSIYRVVNTAGYASVDVSWKQYLDNDDADTYPYTIKLQSSTSAGGPWTDMYSYDPTGSDDLGPLTQRVRNWTTDVGGDLYLRFYISGYTYGMNYWYIDDLLVEGQDPASPSTITVSGTLDLTNGEYAIDDNTLVLTGNVSGSNSITGGSNSNLSVEGSGSNLTLPAISGGLNNFTINRTGGATLGDHLTVNGILDLQSANPSSTQGTLETGNDTLTMAITATSTGTGDVTGFVKRTSFNPNIPYSFGNQYTTVSFTPDGTLPSSLVVSISIGTVPSWFPTAIARVYDFVQQGGSATNATVATHYLDSELNGLAENDLVQWTYGTPGPPAGLYCWFKSSNNTTNNWVAISDVDIGNFPTSFDQLRNTLAAAPTPAYTWDGSTSTSWTETTNWTPEGTPTGISDIVIPDASTTSNDPTLPASTSLNNLTLESGAILNASSGSVLTINGGSGAWVNNGGTFNPSTGNVSFANVNATISGTTTFYDLTVANAAKLTPGSGSYLSIGNSLTLTGTGILEAVLNDNTIDYNGSAQTVINPNGSTSGYHSLVLSGSGTKTMPSDNLNILDNLTLSGTVSATALDTLTIGKDLTVGTGTSLNLGAFSHSIGGDLSVNGGTFTATSASIDFDGSTQQTITNSAGFSLDTLVISNTTDTIVLGSSTNCSIAGDLEVAGVFNLGSNVISSLAGIASGSGSILTQNTSATPLPSDITWSGTLVYNGTSSQTIVGGTYTNLTVSNASGITAAASFTVNGTIDLVEANPSSSQGLLHMGNDTITLGPSSSNSGLGEITGIMKRTTILPDTDYSYGHPYTYVSFPDVGTLPTELYVKLSLGSEPAWKSGAILRIFDIAQTGGNATQGNLYAHYLDSELNGNREEVLVDYVYFASLPLLIEYGRSAYDTAINQIGISNVNIGVFAPILGFNEIGFDEPTITSLTWNGSVSTSWVTAQNWTPIGAPSDSVDIIIPDAATTNNDLTLPAFATCKSITIESGGILNAASGAELTLNGDSLCWVNEGGTFNPGTSTIIFTSSNSFLTGTHEFHDILIESNGTLYLDSAAYLGITGSITTLGAFETNTYGPSTVEYKGTDQTIGSTSKTAAHYDVLLLDGSGTKTLPPVPLTVDSIFTISGTVTAVADTSITINDNMSIESGASFTAGNYAHTINADFTIDGTLTAANSNFIFGGSLAQTISGSNTTTFDSLTINNTAGVTLNMDNLTTVSGALEVNTGGRFILPPAKLLTVSGSMTNLSDSTGVLIQSDATGTGSLIHSTAGVEASVERYMVNDHWHIFSPSVTGQSIPGFVTNAANTVPTSGSNYGMMYYSEAGGGWQYYTDPASGDIGSGTGYLLRHTSDNAVSYYGSLSAASTDVNVTRAANGWNCIGNPFQSSIGVREDAASAENFLDYNAASLDPSYAALYVWDEPDVRVSGVNYYKLISNAAFSHSKPVLDQAYLQPGQGFIVKSPVGGATLSFTTGMRIHETTESFLKSARASWPGLVLNATLGEKETSTSIAFHPDMTTGLDVTYDAGLLGGDPKFRLYSRLVEDNGIKFMLQCLPDEGFGEMIVPLGMDCSETGVISYSMEGIDLGYGWTVILEDRLLNIFTDLTLSTSSYEVPVDSTIAGTGRLFLHIAENMTANPQNEKPTVRAHSEDKLIFIYGTTEDHTEARIIDLSGKNLGRYPLTSNGLSVLDAQTLPGGIYLVQVAGNKGIQTLKVFVK